MKVTIYKNTNFGNNDLVWNVPHPDYDFSVHESIVFDNVYMRFPLLTTRIAVKGDFDGDKMFYDYMIIEDQQGEETRKYYYFINAVLADRGILLFSVTLDAITTFNILREPISGVIIRKHDVNPNEDRFDYPTALNVQGNYINEIYDVVTYSKPVTRFIESAINLSSIKNSVVIPADGEGSIVIPKLPKPSHNTEYVVTAWSGNEISDNSRAFTLYLADLVNEEVLNTVRGLSGDGAISDSYAVPSEAITVTSNGAEVTKVKGNFVTKTLNLKLEIDFSEYGYTPMNKAIEGMFQVAITSLQEKTRIIFPAWDLKNSVDDENRIKVNLWCDPKPSGAPYCCPDQVETLYPNDNTGLITLASLESKSVRGGQWLRNPLIYETGRGEIFSTIETQLQRERAEYERQVALHQLELSQKERDIRIAESNYYFSSGMASSLIGSLGSAFRGDVGSVAGNVKGMIDKTVEKTFIDMMNALKEYEYQAETQLIEMAYKNNLKNLDVQEAIRRITPREVVFQPNDSLGSYEQYNGFAISLLIPDIQTLIAKDIEYSIYGYPVYETVTDFVMLDHLRQNHTVYQFENPIIEIGGKVGDMIRQVLQSGIRILSKPYSRENLLNNPKIMSEDDEDA